MRGSRDTGRKRQQVIHFCETSDEIGELCGPFSPVFVVVVAVNVLSTRKVSCGECITKYGMKLLLYTTHDIDLL